MAKKARTNVRADAESSGRIRTLGAATLPQTTVRPDRLVTANVSLAAAIRELAARVAALEKLVEDAATGSSLSRRPGFRAPAETKDEIRLMLAEMADRAAEYILTGSRDDGEDSEEVILTFDDQREIEPGPRLELQVIGWRLVVEDAATGSAQS